MAAVLKQSDAKAFKYWKMSADQEDALSQLNIGIMYEEGRGVKENSMEAFKYYKMSADNGRAEAQLEIALWYFYQGNCNAEAYKYSKLAAKQGNVMHRLCLII